MSTGLFASVSGVKANQTEIDVISNNVANVNTTAFKSSNANFATVFSNTFSSGSAPSGTLGGINPVQEGTGVQVASISNNFNQGGTSFTGKSSDLEVTGNGFFVLAQPSSTGAASSSYYLTRAGNFNLDSAGNLVSSNGLPVRGTSQLDGSSPTTQSTIKIPQSMTIVKDLNSSGAIVATHFALPGTSSSAISGAEASSATSQNVATVSLVSFSIGANGAITASYSNGDRISVRTDANTVSGGNPSAARTEIIHLPAEGGTFGPDNDGTGSPSQSSDSGLLSQINNVFTAPSGGKPLQGMQLQLQTATVVNPNGLLSDSNNNFLPSINSGPTSFGAPGSGNRSNIQSGALESSNVDLSTEFTNLIVAQRGLEANSKLIKAQSDVMQAIINIIN